MSSYDDEQRGPFMQALYDECKMAVMFDIPAILLSLALCVLLAKCGDQP